MKKEDFQNDCITSMKLFRFLPAVAKALHPTVGTVRPSARLGCVYAFTGVPAFIASIKLGQRSGSTP